MARFLKYNFSLLKNPNCIFNQIHHNYSLFMYTNAQRFSLVIFIFISGLLNAQTTATTKSIFQFLSAKDGAEFQLEFDVTEMVNNKKSEEYLPASLKMDDGTSMGLKVRPRGKFRRRISEVPPIKMKFAKKDLHALGLDTLNEVRLVLPTTFEPESEARILLEYAAYRMYEKANPYHVKARLIRLTLRDRHTEQSRPTVWAMLLEHEEEVAARYGGKIEDNYSMTTDSLQTEYAAINAAFQYMIGNTDWSLSDNRNLYQFRPAAGGKLIPIPYDFDFSGLVNAPYASPTKESGLSNVRERALLSDNLTEKEVKKGIKVLTEHEDDFMFILNRCRLSTPQVHAAQQYIADFFTAVKEFNEIPKRINEVNPGK